MLQSGHIIVTMSSKRTMAAAAFKAGCLAVLDRVAATGESVVVTKWGRPVAEVVPVKQRRATPLAGSVKVHGDLTAPVFEDWDVKP
jgi:prevent-host-death family protein